MTDPVQDILAQLKGARWIAYPAAAILIVIGAANFTDALRKLWAFGRDVFNTVKKRTLTDAQLSSKARDAARGIMTLVGDRQRTEPSVNFNNFAASIDAMLKHSTETQNLYARDYASLVAHLRDEFSKRGLRDSEIDIRYQHPTNYIGLRELAAALGKLAERIQ